jgi:hypothetical protein
LSLLDECLAAYGGLARWGAEEAVEVRVSGRGQAFRMKGNGHPFTDLRCRVRTTGQHVELFDWPAHGDTAVLTSEESRIGDRARAVPRWGRRWDDLDFLAFGGAAMWTYMSLPFVLADWGAEELAGRRLRFRVPEPIRSHCREQTLHLDDGCLIVKHEYVAESFGRWARAMHVSSRFETFDGLPVPTRRRVRLRPLGPVVVRVDVSAARWVQDAARR